MPTVNAGQKLKQKFRNSETTYGLWVSLESPSITEMAVAVGLDWVVIDTEHGHLDFKEVLEHLRALNRSSTVGLVRVQEIEQGVIKRVLDLGAHGVLLPQIKTAEEVERGVYFAKYPPRGFRGIGGDRATSWGKNLKRARTANNDTVVIPLIETVDAVKNIESILSVPDIDALQFGPADLSASFGYPGEWEGPGVAEEILRVKNQIRSRGLASGIMATDSNNGKMRVATTLLNRTY